MCRLNSLERALVMNEEKEQHCLTTIFTRIQRALFKLMGTRSSSRRKCPEHVRRFFSFAELFITILELPFGLCSLCLEEGKSVGGRA